MCYKKNSEIALQTLRDGDTNNNIDCQSVAMLLWRDEMIELLTTFTGIVKGYKSKSRFELSGLITNLIDKIAIEDYVRHSLKTRSSWRAFQLRQLYDD